MPRYHPFQSGSEKRLSGFSTICIGFVYQNVPSSIVSSSRFSSQIWSICTFFMCFLKLFSVHRFSVCFLRWCGRQSVDLRTFGKQVCIWPKFNLVAYCYLIFFAIAHCPDSFSVFSDSTWFWASFSISIQWPGPGERGGQAVLVEHWLSGGEDGESDGWGGGRGGKEGHVLMYRVVFLTVPPPPSRLPCYVFCICLLT